MVRRHVEERLVAEHEVQHHPGGCRAQDDGAEDGRVQLVEATAAGRRLLQKGRARRVSRLARGVAQLTKDDQEVLAWAWYAIAEACQLRSEAVEQQHALERAAEHARAAGDLALEVEVLTRSAPAIIYGAVSVEEGMRYVDRILERLGHDPAVHGLALHIRGHLRARLGEFDGAIEEIIEWRSRFRELGQEMLYAMTAGCVADVCSWAEDWAGGERALRESYELLEGMASGV